jgi:hypothetical protein
VDNLELQINQAEKDIVDCVVVNLENGNLTEEALPEIGRFVLDRIYLLKTHEELAGFLGELSSKWPIFSSIATIEKGELNQAVEKEATTEALNLLKQGKIEDALSLAKNQTNK